MARELFARAERRLARMSPLGATLILTLLAAAGAESVFFVLAWHEGRLHWLPMVNVLIETMAVAMPLILYSRRAIARLEESRRQIGSITRKLAAAVKEAEEASKAKSAFLANMSHELRTPLNAIMGFSEVMKDQHLGPVHNPRYLSYAADIHSSGRHLLGIINDVLDLAKIEAGKMTLESAQEFELIPVLSSSLAMLEGLASKSGVILSRQLLDTDVRILAVERMIRQIVINLVGNAIKFTPTGGSVLLAGRLLPDGGYEIAIRDEGVGMTADEVKLALQPFGQIKNSGGEGARDGTGLGLPLAKAMLELHGGQLTLESQPNCGTIALMQFPAERVVSQKRAAA